MKKTITLVFCLVLTAMALIQPAYAGPPPIDPGNSLAFDGTNDYVALPALNFNSTSFTIEGWVRWDGLTSSWTRFFDFGNGQANNNFLVANPASTNSLRFDIYNGGTIQGFTVANILYAGEYYHLAAVANAGTMSLYVDGVLMGSLSGVTVQNVNRTLCYLGRSNWSGEGYFNGQMDEVRIWNTARTATQISNDMTNQLTGSETGLMAYYNFNQGTAGGNNVGITILDDMTANNYDGTLYNFALTGSTSNWIASNITQPVTMTPPGNALAFDGGWDYVQLPAINLNSTSFTVEGWVNFGAQINNYVRFFDLGNGQASNNLLVTRPPNSNDLWFDIYNGATQQHLVASSIIPVGQYIHIAAVANSGTMYLYVNGELQGTLGSVTVQNINRTKCYLGHSDWPGEANFTGQMDEVSIWNVARTAAQIRSDMSNTLAGNESGLLAYYNFDEGTAGGNNVNITALLDKTGNYNGILRYFVKTNGNTTSNFITGTAMTPYAETSLTATSGGTANGLNQAVFIATDAVVTGSSTLNGANVQITNFVSSQDQLGINGSTGGTTNGITYSFNATTGILALTGFASPANYQTVLRLLTYKNTSANPTTTARNVAISLGTAKFNYQNGHFYQYVSGSYTATASLTAASNTYYLGRQGYLVTITSANENTLVASISSGNTWMAASDQPVTDWKWIAGPENGTQFWEGYNPGSSYNGGYANWYSGEPNNGVGGYYVYLWTSHWPYWDDTQGSSLMNYVAEYGGMAGDPTLPISAGVTVNFNTQYSLTATVGGSTSAVNTLVYIAQDAVVNAWTVNYANVQITNFVSGQDQLGIDGATSGTINGIAYSFNSSTGILALTNTASAANYQATLRLVTYKNVSNSPNTTTRAISMSLGHFYEYISGAINWTNANTAAAARTYFGLPGYLATITSATENATCQSTASGNNAWIGASDAASEGVWRWVTGPEAGIQFWQGNWTGNPVNGMYSNWNSGEPNNSGGVEHYGHIWNTGTWNDYLGGTNTISGYLAEYGGMPGDPAPGIFANGNVTLGYSQSCAGNALAFDGGANYVSLPAINFNSTGLTVEGWMRWNVVPGNWMRFFDFGNGQQNNNILVTRETGTNDLIFDIYNGATQQRAQADNIIPVGQFIHIAAVVEPGAPSTMKLYVNGELKATTTGVTVQNINRTNCYLGHSNWATEPNLNGQMDEVSIWNTARTLTQIQSDMNTPLTGSEAGLMAYYNFDQGTAGGDNTSITTLFDIKGHYNGGNITSFVRTNGNITSNFITSSIGTVPTLAPSTVSNIAYTSATVSSNITDKGWGTVTVRGVCYNTTGTPTIADDKVSETGNFGTGPFSMNLINLVTGVTYYARAYASNSCNTSYGAQIMFIPDYTDLVWTGALTSDWNTAGNWDPNEVPTIGDNVTIPNTGVVNEPVVNEAPATPAVCHSLSIGWTRTFTVASSKALTVDGDLTNSGTAASLIIENGASLITHGTVTGSATVVSGIAANDWHLISPPISDALSGLVTGDYLQEFSEATNNYSDIIPVDIPLLPMTGYALWGGVAGLNVNYTGALNNGPIGSDDNLARTNQGWNLVGNPYSSSLDWDASSGWTKTNLNNAIYIHVNASTWASYVDGVGVNGGTRYIAPCQGFFVRASSSGFATLKTDNNTRVHNNTPFFKDAVSNLVRLELSGSNVKDEIVVRVKPQSTTGFDSDCDAYKLFADEVNAAQLYAVGSELLSINAIPEAKPVTVGVRSTLPGGTYTISATEINNIGLLKLEDKKTQTFNDLTAHAYTFTTQPGDEETRFVLHFTTLDVPVLEDQSDIHIYSDGSSICIDQSLTTNGKVFVYDLSGRQLIQSDISWGMNRIAVQGKGIYLVKVIAGEQVSVKKVLF
ncbi:MAG: T9SS type A sorting domain-containing protein [Bacteroidetes bacterium]|nr:T9SS type A sorting domain-containing protein [Bacteroidota bacterium]